LSIFLKFGILSDTEQNRIRGRHGAGYPAILLGFGTGLGVAHF